MATLEVVLWVLLGLGLGLALVLALRLRRLEKRRAASGSRVSVARVTRDSRSPPKRAKLPSLPKLLEDGDDLEITVIERVAPDALELLDLEEADELRPSRVDLMYEDEAHPEEPTAPKARILMSASGDTDCGRQRTRNEDRLLVKADRSVFVVADGMGGHAGGAIASELAVRALDEAYSQGAFRGELASSGSALPRRARELSLAIQQANHAVYNAAVSRGLTEMGTTLVVAKFSPHKQRVYIGHVGDSRCYRLREGSIRQLTTDHNLASVGLHGPHDNRLVRALGIQPTVTIDLIVDRPRPGDVYCLCSDGLPRMVSDAEILAIVEGEADLEGAVRALIALANERGGKDNITVVLVCVLEAVPARLSASSA